MMNAAGFVIALVHGARMRWFCPSLACQESSKFTHEELVVSLRSLQALVCANAGFNGVLAHFRLLLASSLLGSGDKVPCYTNSIVSSTAGA